MKAVNLRTEHLVDPIGIDIRTPYLSWNCEEGKKQTAYEIEAVSDGKVVWNSGKKESDEMHTTFGKEAESRQNISWKVRLWDENGKEGEWSKEGVFELGILEKNQFVAKWINPELVCDPKVHKPASYLKTSFFLEKAGRARLYITCHGLYEASINGKRVGNFVLAPGTYTYDKRLAYQTYDVSGLVHEGENEVQVILGPPGSAGHNPFSMPEADGDNRQGYGSSGSLLPETVPPGISAGAWAFFPFPAVSSPYRKARSPVPAVRRLLSFSAHTGRRQNQSHPHPHRSRSSGNADPASCLGFYRYGTDSKPSRSDLHGFHNAPQPVLL